MKKLIQKHIADFVQMDPEQAVKLTERWFGGDYNAVAQELRHQTDLAYNFLNTVLKKNEAQILEEYENSVLTSQPIPGPSPKFTTLLLNFLEILIDRKFRAKIVEYVSQDYFPIDESLKICESDERKYLNFKQAKRPEDRRLNTTALEASAILYYRKGSEDDYRKSIELYVQVLANQGPEIVYSLV